MERRIKVDREINLFDMCLFLSLSLFDNAVYELIFTNLFTHLHVL